MIDSKSFITRFISKEHIAKDTYSFHFERPADFSFLPGQYNRWTLPITATDGRGSSRFFTIASSPLDKETLTITTNSMQSDFKKALLHLKKNDEIKMFGPMGNLILDDTNTTPRIFIAGGIGITPFYSMLTYAAIKNLTLPLTLIVAFSLPEIVVYYEELKKLEEQQHNITIVYTITTPEKSHMPWKGEKGRISETLIRKYVPDISNAVWYVVGPPSMQEAIIQLLKNMHISEEKIVSEAFTGYEIPD